MLPIETTVAVPDQFDGNRVDPSMSDMLTGGQRRERSRSQSAADTTNCPCRTSFARVRYAARSTRTLSSNRGNVSRARRRGLGSMVNRAASASARSSSRSMLSSSSRSGFSAVSVWRFGHVVSRSWLLHLCQGAAAGTCGDRPAHARRARTAAEDADGRALVRLEAGLAAGLRKAVRSIKYTRWRQVWRQKRDIADSCIVDLVIPH